MRVIPPMISQPLPDNQIPTNISLQATSTEQKPINTIETVQNNIIPPVSNNELIIKKKKQYRQFIRLIKQGKFTTAMLTSKILGVQRNTIMEWLETRQAKEAMSLEVNTFVDKISNAKDWKAQAYLLDKVIDNDKQSEHTTTLNSLIQINV